MSEGRSANERARKWNDNQERTAEDVILAMKRAAHE